MASPPVSSCAAAAAACAATCAAAAIRAEKRESDQTHDMAAENGNKTDNGNDNVNGCEDCTKDFADKRSFPFSSTSPSTANYAAYMAASVATIATAVREQSRPEKGREADKAKFEHLKVCLNCFDLFDPRTERCNDECRFHTGVPNRSCPLPTHLPRYGGGICPDEMLDDGKPGLDVAYWTCCGEHWKVPFCVVGSHVTHPSEIKVAAFRPGLSHENEENDVVEKFGEMTITDKTETASESDDHAAATPSSDSITSGGARDRADSVAASCDSQEGVPEKMTMGTILPCPGGLEEEIRSRNSSFCIIEEEEDLKAGKD